MNVTLLRKALRDLLPWGILMAVLAATELAELVTRQIDMLPLGSTFSMLNSRDTFLYWLVAFAIGTGLAIREHDDGTIGFLDGLPVSRTRVFLTQCAVMLALVLLAPVVRIGSIAGLHALSRGSLDAEWHAPLLVQAAALHALLLSNGLLIGAALGRLRSLTWLVLGVAAAALMVLADRAPWTASLNPVSLLDWQWSTTGLRVDGTAVAVQSVTAGVAFLIAWQGFVRGGGSGSAAAMARPVAGAAVTIATIAAAIAVLVLVVPRIEPPPDEEIDGPPSFAFAASPPAETHTAHFRISYPAHESAAALALAARADEIFERVHALLGVPLGERIDVDASGSARNTHGTAFFGRIRMRLDGDAAAVLAHETTHVVAQRAAGGATAVLWDAAPVLNEGLASWIESQYRAPSSRADDRMLTLAALYMRRELRIEELAEPNALDAVRDEGLRYSAGEALIRAMTRRYGDGAVSRLLAAFGDPTLPADLGGMRLWQSAMQIAGMDLGAVVDDFFRAVASFADEHAERIAALPRPRVSVVRDGGRYGVVALVDELPGGEAGEAGEAGGAVAIVLRFRPAPDSPVTTFTAVDTTVNHLHRLTPERISGGRVCVQPGIKIGGEQLLEPWTCLPLRDAAEFRGAVD